MPRDNLTAAIQEAYATSRTDVFYLDTLEITHPNLEAALYIVNDRIDHFLRLEPQGLDAAGAVVQFLPVGFRMQLPASGENGVQDLQLAVDNVNREPVALIKKVLGSAVPVQIVYRPYLSNNAEGPQMTPPLTLYLTDCVITATEVTATATYADVLNRVFLSESYAKRRFPSL